MNKNYEEKVSVIIPVYNVEKYLARCVESVINQTYDNLEIIIVNDGSTDKSLDVCKKYKLNDNRIILIDKENGGLSSARNAGMKIATGKYILFIDSDDWIINETIRNLVQYAEKYKTDFVRFSPMHAGNKMIEDGMPWEFPVERQISYGYYDKNKIINNIFKKLLITENLTLGPIVSAALSLYSRVFLENNNIYFDEDVKYSEDVIFSAKVVYNADSFYFIKDGYYYYYYNNEGSITRSFRKDRWESCKKLSYELEKYFIEKDSGYFSKQIELINLYNILNGIGQTKLINGFNNKYKYIDNIVNDNFTINSIKVKIPSKISWKLKLILLFIRLRLKFLITIIMR